MNAPLPIPADDRALFHANRLTGIGGSDAATALGISPWRTPLELYLEKRGEIAPEEENDAMLWGKLLEPVIRQRYANLTGRTVRVPPFMRHPKHDFATAHLDGLTDDERLFEAKTAYRYNIHEWGEQGTDQIPRLYTIQVQHYLAVAAKPVADVAVLIAGRDFRIYEVPADPELQEMILDGEADFWKRLQAGEAPDPDFHAPSTMSLIKRMYPGTNGLTIDATPEQARWKEILDDSAARAALYAVSAENAKAHLLYEMKDNAVMNFPDGKALRRKEVKKKSYLVAESKYIDGRFVNQKE